MKAIKYLITLFWLPTDLILAYVFAFTGIVFFGILFILINIGFCILYYWCGCKIIEEKEKEKGRNKENE